jgi:hypothetical protein
MKLYHGSNCDFSIIDLSKSKDRRDFGKGFYLTTHKNQAEDWAEILNDQVSIHTEKALTCLTLINKTNYGNDLRI